MTVQSRVGDRYYRMLRRDGRKRLYHTLYEYQLEQMPDSNGCGLTNYEEGPNEREDDSIDMGGRPPDDNPNGGGAGGSCPDASQFDSYQECLDNWGQDHSYCMDLCFDEDYDDGSGICDTTCTFLCGSGSEVIKFTKCFGKCSGGTLGFGAKPCAIVCAGIAGLGCWLGCNTICDSW